MKHSTQLRRVLLGAAAVLMMEHGAVVWAQHDAGTVAPMVGSRPPLGSLLPPPADAGAQVPLVDEQASADASQGDVAPLMQLIRDRQIVELRTTYNGSYGASLFFYPPDMTWYVALFQDKHLWRVIKSQEKSRAEMVYENFVLQTVQFADVEIRRTELQAQKTFLERVIALHANRAQQLQTDLSVARSQQAEVAQRQKSAQEQTQALQVEKRAAQVQLRDLQEQVRQLERQAETGLPTHK